MANGGTTGQAAIVSWAPPAALSNGTPGNNGSSITGYTVIAVPAGGNPSATTVSLPVNGGSTLSATVGDLFDGTLYDITVTATNGIGTSNSNVYPFTPAGVPFPPDNVYAYAGTDKNGNPAGIVYFSAPPQQADGTPGDNGSAISAYVVTASPSGQQTRATQQSPGGDAYYAVLTLPVGSYSFTAAGVNSIGQGIPSQSSPVITLVGTPTPPTIGTATPGNGSACVSWTAPSNLDGTTLTGYLVVGDLGAQSQVESLVAPTDTSTCLMGLTNGQLYVFSVLAESGGGNSGYSNASNAVTPAGQSNAPVITSAVGEDGSINLAWSPPTQLNGATVNGYTILVRGSDGSSQNLQVPDVTSDFVPGLTNGLPYYISVQANTTTGSTTSPSVSAYPEELAGSDGPRIDSYDNGEPCIDNTDSTGAEYGLCRPMTTAGGPFIIDAGTPNQPEYVTPGPYSSGGGNYDVATADAMYEGCSYDGGSAEWTCTDIDTDGFLVIRIPNGPALNFNPFSVSGGLTILGWVACAVVVGSDILAPEAAPFDAGAIVSTCLPK